MRGITCLVATVMPVPKAHTNQHPAPAHVPPVHRAARHPAPAQHQNPHVVNPPPVATVTADLGPKPHAAILKKIPSKRRDF